MALAFSLWVAACQRQAFSNDRVGRRDRWQHERVEGRLSLNYLRFRKTDFLIPAAGLVVAAAVLICSYFPVFGTAKGNTAVVYVDGEEYGRYPLSQDTDIIIPGKNGLNNELVIKNGEADIVDALCPDKICVHERKISRAGETLVCLPNRVVVEIEGERDEIDAVAR